MNPRTGDAFSTNLDNLVLLRCTKPIAFNSGCLVMCLQIVVYLCLGLIKNRNTTKTLAVIKKRLKL